MRLDDTDLNAQAHIAEIKKIREWQITPEGREYLAGRNLIERPPVDQPSLYGEEGDSICDMEPPCGSTVVALVALFAVASIIVALGCGAYLLLPLWGVA